MNQINKIRLSLKFPNTYLEYDDIESLWEYAIRNSSKLEVNYEDLDFKQDSKMEDIFASFYDIFEDEKSNNIIHKWIREILVECDKYYVENIQNLDGGNFFISHSLVHFSIIKDEEIIIDSEKRLNELIDCLSAQEIIEV